MLVMWSRYFMVPKSNQWSPLFAYSRLLTSWRQCLNEFWKRNKINMRDPQMTTQKSHMWNMGNKIMGVTLLIGFCCMVIKVCENSLRHMFTRTMDIYFGYLFYTIYSLSCSTRLLCYYVLSDGSMICDFLKNLCLQKLESIIT